MFNIKLIVTGMKGYALSYWTNDDKYCSAGLLLNVLLSLPPKACQCNNQVV